MLTLEEILEYSLTRDGQFLIPPETFNLDRPKLEKLFRSIVRGYEKYKPLIRQEQQYLDRYGKIFPEAYSIKSLCFAANQSYQVIPSMLRPINVRYWHFDPVTHLLRTQANTWYLVSYCKHYTHQNLSILEPTGTMYEGLAEYRSTLQAAPMLSSLEICVGNDIKFTVAPEQESSLVLLQEANDLGSGEYDPETREFTLLLNEELATDEETKASYVTKYKGFLELESTDDLLMDMFQAELLCSLGSLKAMSQLDASPVKWNADDLMSYGRELRAKLLERKPARSDWYQWLP